MSKKNKHIEPPRLATCFLRWYCRSELVDEVEGDLYELFKRRVETQSIWKAKALYWLNVLMFLHPDYIRKRKDYTTTNHTAMFRNYFKAAYRSLTKRVSYTLINILGLSIGLTASLCIALFIFLEFSYDKNHQNAERIYRVETQKIRPEGTSIYAGAPLGVSTALHTDFSEVEAATSIVYQYDQLIDIPSTANKFSENIAFADHQLFSVFDYEWVAGNPETALTEPNTVLLTEETARKYFTEFSKGEVSDVVGKIIRLNDQQDLKVDGILQNYPSTTSFPFHMMVSFSTLKNVEPDLDINSWGGWSDNNQTYILLAEGASAPQLEEQFPAMLEKYKGRDSSQERGHVLVPLKDIHFSNNYGARVADKDSLYSLGLIGLFLLGIASINFVNLSTAQATERSKEVGVRKVLGGSRSQLVFQFISEAVLITLVSFLLALSMLIMLMPYVSEFMHAPLSASSLFTPEYMGFILIAFVMVSLLSGLYPAWILSRFSPVKAIKEKISAKRGSGFTLRQLMVTFQFVICQVLLIGTVVISGQMKLFSSADLGFESERIVIVDLPSHSSENLEIVRNQLLQDPQVAAISFSNNSASAETNFMRELLYQTDSGEVNIRAQFKYADAHFLKTYGIKLIAGNPLQESDSSRQVLINEVMLQKMGFNKAEEAIGTAMDEYIVKGVVKDFHVNSLHQSIDPTVIVIAPQHYYQAGIKLQSMRNSQTNLQAAISHIQSVWEDIFPEQIFSYQFLDDRMAQAYASEQQMMRIINLFTAIAILISCLGLYGLVSFITLQRTKEVGIRKVLGASVQQIVYLFNKDFVVLVMVAFVIAAPLGYYFMQQWLADFTYKISMSWWMFALAALAGLIVAGITVSFQSIKAAVANPVDSLRNE